VEKFGMILSNLGSIGGLELEMRGSRAGLKLRGGTREEHSRSGDGQRGEKLRMMRLDVAECGLYVAGVSVPERGHLGADGV